MFNLLWNSIINNGFYLGFNSNLINLCEFDKSVSGVFLSTSLRELFNELFDKTLWICTTGEVIWILMIFYIWRRLTSSKLFPNKVRSLDWYIKLYTRFLYVKSLDLSEKLHAFLSIWYLQMKIKKHLRSGRQNFEIIQYFVKKAPKVFLLLSVLILLWVKMLRKKRL